MIKLFLLISLMSSSCLFAQEFSGCGEYLFKGILRHDEHAPLKMIYVVNEGTKSQLNFDLIEKDDVIKLALVLNLPTTITGNIEKPMDGTKGSLTMPTEIARRFPNPLKNNDTGITKIKIFKCI
ncbi:MAG: hypothetical protein H7281_06490 [Bacteriovorax sp.]|nr:hypothetical protein [Bacteriovorax sp.]